jgi:hypothetical protein
MDMGNMTLAELGAKLEADGLDLELQRQAGMWWCRIYAGAAERTLVAVAVREVLSVAIAASFEYWEEGR